MEPTCSGVGRALRSTLPFTVNGSSGSTTRTAGTMYSGSLAFSSVRKPSVVTCASVRPTT
ncbi:hypothetical protein COSO111634_33450 [Corallococcus soli]